MSGRLFSMFSFLGCRRFWRRPVFVLVPLGLVFLLSLLFATLRFGNHQWNKWICVAKLRWPQVFMSSEEKYQAFAREVREYSVFVWPEDFTGVWREYCINGNPLVYCEVKDGQLHGEWRNWYFDGKPRDFRNYVNGRLYGRWRKWYEDGNIILDMYINPPKSSYCHKRDGWRAEEMFLTLNKTKQNPVLIRADDDVDVDSIVKAVDACAECGSIAELVICSDWENTLIVIEPELEEEPEAEEEPETDLIGE